MTTTERLPGGLFDFDGKHYLPSEFTRGPWRPDAQHGGPPSALLAHLCEPLVDAKEFLSQIEVELVRPVPLTPLHPEARRRRVSGRVSRIDATLSASVDGHDTVVAIASALVLRETELLEPDWLADAQPATAPPSESAAVDPPRWASGDVTTYHRNAVEHRFTEGSFRSPGPAVDWTRLRLPVISGEEPSGLERLAAAADFGSGISAIYGAKSPVGLINANLTIARHRDHSGEWVSLDATTHLGPQGTGLGVTKLGDTNGLVAIGTQSLLGYSTRR